MGFLKKIFKPVSKVLDKVIPNEIKTSIAILLQHLHLIYYQQVLWEAGVLSRALMGGGLNIFGQLAQEGNEGDINLLSAGLGALSGAMSAPGESPTVGDKSNTGPDGSDIFKDSRKKCRWF